MIFNSGKTKPESKTYCLLFCSSDPREKGEKISAQFQGSGFVEIKYFWRYAIPFWVEDTVNSTKIRECVYVLAQLM